MLSLPRITGDEFHDAIQTVPYLKPDPEVVSSWAPKINENKNFKVGICWQGNPGYKEDGLRSVPLFFFEGICHEPDIELWSLQKGTGLEQVGGFSARDKLVLPGSRLDEANGAFMDSAALITLLDLVVTSDTAVAHLAGGLGARVWLTLPYVADCRWGREGEFTDWYPNMRMFRQETPGEWGPVFEDVRVALAKLRASA